eukprot:COSAG04_NODE_1207_length_7734_cov_2.251081_2_plen_365_part_00
MRQMVAERPICWAGDVAPITIIGSSNWTDISVSASILVEEHGQPWIGARIGGRSGDPAPGEAALGHGLAASDALLMRARGGRLTFTDANGVLLGVSTATQTWTLAPCVTCFDPRDALAHGPLPTSLHIALDTWHSLQLEVVGGSATGTLDGHTLFEGTNVAVGPHRQDFGYAAMGLANYTAALFDDWKVQAAHAESLARLKSDDTIFVCSGDPQASAAGSDYGLSPDAPMATIDEAIQHLQTDESATGIANIALCSDEPHEVERPIVLSGASGVRFHTYRRLRGETPSSPGSATITGGRRVSGWRRWAEATGHPVWRAPAPRGVEFSRLLTINGKRVNRTSKAVTGWVELAPPDLLPRPVRSNA